MRERAPRTRHAAHLAPLRPGWRAAASYSSESACSRIPSSPASPWRAPGFGAAAAAAIVCGGRGPGAAAARQRVEAGCVRARHRVRTGCCSRCCHCCHRRRRHLRPRAASAARASSVTEWRARRLLLLPRRCAARANQRGQREERRPREAGCGCVRVRRGSLGGGRGRAPGDAAAAEQLLWEPCASPSPQP